MADRIVDMGRCIDRFDHEYACLTKLIWNDASIQKVFLRRAELQVNDTAPYFFESIDRIANDNFIPTERDVLMCRIRTTGIVEVNIKINIRTYN
jgi:guanine nucleotide-binding protein G(i) subunit alpha